MIPLTRHLAGRAARGRWRRVLDATPARARRWPAAPAAIGRQLPVLAVLGGGAVGGALGGPVAAGVAAVYGLTGAVAWRRTRVVRTEAACRGAAVDAVATLAAELRAGQPVGAALTTAAGWLAGPGVVGRDAATVARRVASAVALAESSGAPLADVLDRLDTHLRAIDRARASASAQAAGARASALLLSCMPVAGVGLGYLVGVDPLRILLRTPLGAVCLAGAVGLQLAGLAWSARLSRIEVAA